MANEGDDGWLFGGESNGKNEWEAHRRFISDSYNPIYRQGVLGPQHLSESTFTRFLEKSRVDLSGAAQMFMAWVRTDRPLGGDYADVVMERLTARAPSMDAETARGVVAVFADVMDEYYLLRPKREMFVDVWDTAEAIIHTFHKSIDGFEIGETLERLAGDGQAISWLTGGIGRSELWGHGLAGDQPTDEPSRILTAVQLRTFMDRVVGRILKLTRSEIIGLPRLGGMLFALRDSPWHAVETRKILNRVAGPRTQDRDYLSFMEAMTGVVVSSDRGAYLTLSVKALRDLLGEEEFNGRWERLKKKNLPDDLDEVRAKVISMIAARKNW
ncbi:hypothetical protein [Brevundimonas sp.]|uniref:hypothetical protein n=1 Tax=Brevundimonas sp. TaxID=1871086 RepID=UPI00286D123E|nr:hypothetical protein [Brevundimonas sp.]